VNPLALWNNRDMWRSPEAYAGYVRRCGSTPQAAFFLRSSAEAGAYPQGDHGWRYKFERLAVHDKLEKAYGLCEIAGQGSVFERALRIMDWLSAHVWYNGMSVITPSFCRGKRLGSLRRLRFSYGKVFWRALNCAHMAYILADCLISAGIQVMPLAITNDSYWPGDNPGKGPCHAVVHAWLPEERRWIMLDPSFNAYITDGEGRVLNLAELQAAHGAGEQIHIAQYSFNGTQDCKAEYLSGFVLGALINIHAWDGTADLSSFARNKLLPEGVPLVNANARAITIPELLAEPKFY